MSSKIVSPPSKGIAAVEAMPLLLAFALMLVCPLAAGLVAGRKGRSSLLWAIFGLFLGVIAVGLALVVPARSNTADEF